METFWSGYFGLWKPDDMSIRFRGRGHEKWELTTYGTAAVSLDESAIGVLRFVGDRKSVLEIFEGAYDVHLHVQRQGSVEDLYKSVHDAFYEKATDLAAWAPR
ncbi:uncharacterized protein P174DRAFT_425435 [Aspergillus novofumigatus IBT 16806]|uniref:Uncharacterized protein n=1 Tax=Aspergillus novofumigatus (strain IBT 16806) TaxID=1392255 RepID=A0A2I1BTZ9_ASPN1|nr:uncharacterized protein P174DRAFT_425435 [Aspergillus novofumigatus IBT 16806]PKX88878.1 hypothetical protein P174DRAFT_425435 [Aspergillus novofumigatus IBT 16806]